MPGDKLALVVVGELSRGWVPTQVVALLGVEQQAPTAAPTRVRWLRILSLQLP